jgi:hypothetical protein
VPGHRVLAYAAKAPLPIPLAFAATTALHLLELAEDTLTRRPRSYQQAHAQVVTVTLLQQGLCVSGLPWANQTPLFDGGLEAF